MTREEAKKLLEKFERNETSKEEEALIEAWYQSLEDEKPSLEFETEPEDLLNETFETVQKKIRPSSIKPFAIAASLLLVSAVLYIYTQTTVFTNRQQQTSQIIEDIYPGGNRAQLTLANGQTIDLREDQKGITMDADSMVYEDGSILHTLISMPSTESTDVPTELLSLRTPKGGQYQITLPDGSKVWLNAATTLKYPTRFSGAERRVELSGEAYFEVAKNEKQSFIVESDGQEVKVLGTKFNINSYQIVGNNLTTLVEGSIQISQNSTNKQLILRPNEQALVNGEDFKITKVDIEEYISWKEGMFIFHDLPLKEVLFQLEKWYNIEIPSTGLPNVAVYGEISRTTKLSEVLKLLEVATGLSFKVEERRLTLESK